MAYTQGLCSAIQVNLNDVAGTNAPALARQKVGKWINSHYGK